MKPRAGVSTRKTTLRVKRTAIKRRFTALRGTRRINGNTDDTMNLLREYDGDARDPGFGAGKK